MSVEGRDLDDSARSREIGAGIGAVLRRDWDPIGVHDEPAAASEYDSYVPGIQGLIVSGASVHEIAQHLGMLEETQLGLRRRTHADLMSVARTLRAIPARLEQGLPAVPAAGETKRRLYSPHQISVGAIIGSPLAGGWLLAENFRALDLPDARAHALIWSSAATALVLTLSFFLPPHFPTAVLPAAYASGYFAVARQTQGAAYAAHLAAGGARHSHWRMIGASLVALVIVVVVLFAVLLVLPEQH